MKIREVNIETVHVLPFETRDFFIPVREYEKSQSQDIRSQFGQF